MAHYMGVDGIEYYYHGEMSDPTVEYKGISWSEWELHDAVQSLIDEDIAEGTLPENTTYEQYVSDKNNHCVIIDILEDWITAQQTEELETRMSEKAGDIFNSELESEFVSDAVSEISEWSAKDGELYSNLLCRLAASENDISDISNDINERFGGSLAEKIADYLCDNYDSSDLLSIASDVGVGEKLNMPCVIYLQNNKSYILSDTKYCGEKLKELSEKYENLSALVYSVNGTMMCGTLDSEQTYGIALPESDVIAKAYLADIANQSTDKKKDSVKKVDYER